MLSSSATKRSKGMPSAKDWWIHQRKGPVLLRFRLQDAGVLGEDVLPVGDPMVGPAGGGEDSFNRFLAAGVGRVSEVGTDFGGGWPGGGGKIRAYLA